MGHGTENATSTENSNILLNFFNNSTEAITAINLTILQGFTNTTTYMNKFDISNETYPTQAELESDILSILMADITNSGIVTTDIHCGIVTSDFSNYVTLVGGAYQLTSDIIEKSTSSCTTYTSFTDITNNIVDIVSNIVTQHGFTSNHIIFKKSDGTLVTTTKLGTEQIFSIKLTTVIGFMRPFGGAFIHDVFFGACLSTTGIVESKPLWTFSAMANNQYTQSLQFLEYIYETTNRVEFNGTHHTTELHNQMLQIAGLSSGHVPTIPPPPSGTYGWDSVLPPPDPSNT